VRDHTKLQKDLESTGGLFPAACHKFVIPAEAGIQQDPTGFPRIKYGAGVSSPE
jgi:hypothetical protein